ncbi:hypothetical protein WICANDRAFT_79251 [Wickerhamomyces anomalus NRRL Y-366-8]|uniref:Transmembrane protein n=1 Tax=Wickerhamomyces anomalus (strain ATCC 58044 / CBS 1984 / NCYC 433 / NRRL Y-366-8) TaxID=683960 RepID=A0A1E3P0B2_WICAA|nr:uncharacterized protein WICANDRAFT_79251 [Wickerhamomyces anomalus NRRL Y-366-8]ODQ58704.1 hypothetical protein WICANDRAFT_79251 [Wickerhamomyces anomalus NRRL Y-366-8]
MLLLQLFNIAMLANLVIQNNQIFDLFKNQFLNSSKLRRLYKSYFLLSIITFSGFTFLNIQSKDYFKLLFTIPLLITSTIYIIRCFITRIDPFDQYENQLLITSAIQSPSQINSTGPVAIIRTSQGDFKSEDVSPILSTNNTTTHIGSLTKKDNNLSAPILATLLGAETVMARPLMEPSTSSTTIPILAILISISFIFSQWCYITAIFKSNVYTPLRQYLVTALINLIISTTLIIFTEFQLNDIAMIQFGQFNMGLKICNYLISISLLLQSVSTIMMLMMSRKHEKEALQVVEVYNSIPSPRSISY